MNSHLHIYLDAVERDNLERKFPFSKVLYVHTMATQEVINNIPMPDLSEQVVLLGIGGARGCKPARSSNISQNALCATRERCFVSRTEIWDEKDCAPGGTTHEEPPASLIASHHERSTRH